MIAGYRGYPNVSIDDGESGRDGLKAGASGHESLKTDLASSTPAVWTDGRSGFLESEAWAGVGAAGRPSVCAIGDSK